MTNQHLALLPLDDRPPTFVFPQRIATIAGLNLIIPPRELLGNFLQPGNSIALTEWLLKQKNNVDGILIAVDMLAYGGLVASRSPITHLTEAMHRLEILREIKAMNPQIHLLAASVILRISITASNTLIARQYRNIIRYSELSYRIKFENREDLRDEFNTLIASIPPAILQDYLNARQRNHEVNLKMIEMLAEGTLDKLLLLQEDASVAGPHLIEQQKLRERATSLGVDQRIDIYPGADEGTQTLLASWINQALAPQINVIFTSEKAAEKAVPFEDRPLHQTVLNHLNAAGCKIAEEKDAVAILWVHTPCSTADIQKAVDGITILLEQGKNVALADVRFPNGSDPVLMEALCKSGLLPRLAAYAAWNTAGNTIGTCIAHLCAWLSALQNNPGPEQQEAQNAFLWERMVDDWGYQRILRQPLEMELRQKGLDPLNLGTNKGEVERLVAQRLRNWANDLYNRSGWGEIMPELSIRLPWPRTFEVEVVSAERAQRTK